MVLAAFSLGCGGTKTPVGPPPVKAVSAAPKPKPPADVGAPRAKAPPPAVSAPRDAAPEASPRPRVENSKPPAGADDPANGIAPASLAPVDEAKVEAQGIRKLASEHLTLYTDLPLDDEITALPEAFDQAYPQWRNYFGLADENERPWRVMGRLMKDEAKFRAAGLLPAELPQFVYGYARNDEIWWREQPSAYYRRHLMLHEGTHSFMYANFGSCGPPWYMEGMAELLGTHSFVDGKLTLDVFPKNRDDVPYWGRVKIIRDAIKAGQPLSLDEVLNLEPGLQSPVAHYGWCWATTAFLDGHPRYRERFRRLPAEVRKPDFNGRLRTVFAEDWSDLNEEWQCFVLELDYGYDLARNAIEFAAGEPLAAGGQRVNIEAARGWQSSGIRLEAGKKYSLKAGGRYQLAAGPPVWWCEPNGVTIRYHAGRPLGMLLAAVHPDPYDPAIVSSLLSPIEIGLGAELTPDETGTLYLRINDSPAELADNAGSLAVEVTAD